VYIHSLGLFMYIIYTWSLSTFWTCVRVYDLPM
jgi:hypothetical protein